VGDVLCGIGKQEVDSLAGCLSLCKQNKIKKTSFSSCQEGAEEKDRDIREMLISLFATIYSGGPAYLFQSKYLVSPSFLGDTACLIANPTP
jgi:hypothetical protein